MAMPQFTAEASLPRGRRTYVARHTFQAETDVVIAQQQRYNPYSICQDVCIDCLISGPTSYFCRQCDDCIRSVMTA
jgi:hypothetical protein